jgi:hypothetical protein
MFTLSEIKELYRLEKDFYSGDFTDFLRENFIPVYNEDLEYIGYEKI